MPVWMREEPLSAGTVRRQGRRKLLAGLAAGKLGNAVEHAEGTGQCGGIRRRRHHPVLYAGRRCAGADAARVPALSGRRPALRLGQPGRWYGLRRRAVQGRRNTGANMSAAGKQAAYVLSFDILREPPEAFGLRYDPDAGTYVYEAEQKQKKENGEYGNHFGQDHIGV